LEPERAVLAGDVADVVGREVVHGADLLAEAVRVRGDGGRVAAAGRRRVLVAAVGRSARCRGQREHHAEGEPRHLLSLWPVTIMRLVNREFDGCWPQSPPLSFFAASAVWSSTFLSLACSSSASCAFFIRFHRYSPCDSL